MNRTKLILAALALLLGGVGQARADFIVDQSFQYNPNLGANGFGIPAFSPIGEAFVPTLTSVDHVQLGLSEITNGGPGATLHVNIHQDTIQGTILGTSSEITLPASTGQVFPEIHDFTFANAVGPIPKKCRVGGPEIR